MDYNSRMDKSLRYRYPDGNSKVTDVSKIKEIFSADNQDLDDQLDIIIGKDRFSLCRWGSCQYTRHNNLFDILQYLCKKNEPIDNIYRLFKLPLDLGNMVDFPTIKEKLMEESRIFCAKYRDDDTLKRQIEYQIKIYNAYDLSEIFYICRESGWDLGQAAYEIFDIVWPNRPGLINDENAQAEASSENAKYPSYYETGLICWLLVHKGLVHDDSCYQHFDT